MNERAYHLPAIAACAVAFGFPLLMVFDAVQVGLSGWNSINGSGPILSDFLFLSLGILSLIAYLGFRDWLRMRLNYRTLDLPLMALVALLTVFHLSAFLLALLGWVVPEEVVAFITAALWIGFAVLVGIVDLAIAILLIRDRAQLPGLLMAFAITTGVLGLLELSVVFALGIVVVLPMVMISIALCLMYRPDFLEVV